MPHTWISKDTNTNNDARVIQNISSQQPKALGILQVTLEHQILYSVTLGFCQEQFVKLDYQLQMDIGILDFSKALTLCPHDT